MADLTTIKAFERKEFGLNAGSVGGAIDDQVAGALPSVSSLLEGLPLIPESVKVDLRQKEGHVKLSVAERIREWVGSFEVGGKSLGEWLEAAISGAVESVYKLFGESDQFAGAKHLLENTKNLEGKIDAFTATLPQKLQPPKGYLAALTVESINEAARSMEGLTADGYDAAIGAVNSGFDKTKAASERVAAKVFEKTYVGLAAYYKEQGYSDDDARKYAAAVAEEYTGMRLEMKDGRPTLVAAPEGQSGGIRQYFHDVVAAARAGRDAGTVALQASTPESLKDMKATDAALQQGPAATRDGDHLPAGEHVTPPPAVVKPMPGAAVSAGK